MNVHEIAPGLWRWTGLHPDWTPADGGSDGWEQEVGCVYYEAPGAVVLIDPLVPPEDRERFLRHLDHDVGRMRLPVAILLTVPWHRRSADELADRYGVPVGGDVADVEALPLAGWEETLYWIGEHRALVAGDALLGADDGGVRVCPRSRVGEEAWADFLASLEPLRRLPVDRVLVSHGQPVLSGGRESLARALGR